MMRKLGVSMALVLLASAVSAEGQWTVGIGGEGTTGIYVGEGDETSFVPYVAYDTEKLHIGLDGVSYQVYDYGLGHVDVGLTYRLAPSFPKGADLFKGLNRKDAVEVALGTELQFGNAYVGVNALRDVSDAHGGTEVDVSLGYNMSFAGLEFDGAVGARYRDKELNQYLYGVSASEATALRPAYSAGATTTGFASLAVAYPITESISAVGQIAYEDLGDNKKSPLVEKSSQTSAVLGLTWTF